MTRIFQLAVLFGALALGLGGCMFLLAGCSTGNNWLEQGGPPLLTTPKVVPGLKQQATNAAARAYDVEQALTPKSRFSFESAQAKAKLACFFLTTNIVTGCVTRSNVCDNTSVVVCQTNRAAVDLAALVNGYVWPVTGAVQTASVAGGSWRQAATISGTSASVPLAGTSGFYRLALTNPAAPTTLAWTGASSPFADGSKVYWWAKGRVTNEVDAGLSSSALVGLYAGVTNTVAVTTYSDVLDYETPMSAAMVSYLPPLVVKVVAR